MRTAPVGFPPESPPKASFLKRVIEVITPPLETTVASLIFAHRYQDVFDTIVPDPSSMIYVVTLFATVSVPPAYTHSVDHTR